MTFTNTLRTAVLCALLGGALAAAPLPGQTAHAQSSQQIQSANAMAEWSEQITAIQIEVASIYSGKAMMAIMAAMSGQEEADIDRMHELAEALDSERRAMVESTDAAIAALPAPERWDISNVPFSPTERKIHSATKAHYAGLRPMRDRTDRQVARVVSLLRDFEDVTEEDLAAFAELQREGDIALIENENRMIDGYLRAIPSSNPNHQFQRVVKQLNLAIIAELRIPDYTDAAAMRRGADAMDAALEPVDALIRKGRANQSRMDRQFAAAVRGGGGSAEELAFVRRAREAMETFDETFDIEDEMLANTRNSVAAYRSGEGEDAIAARIEANDARMFELVDRRMALVQKRQQMIQSP